MLCSTIGFILPGCKQGTPSPDLEDIFKNPPAKYNVNVWWHWMDGAISRQGITRDLESMAQQGIKQATILNVGLFEGRDFGKEKIKFNTPEWHQMFRWALEEANRLGITIGVHNCDGWSSSGGPWIAPEKAMKQATWTKTLITSADNSPLILPHPTAVEGFYRDVAVVAVRTEQLANSFIKARPTVKINKMPTGTVLTDGSPVSFVPVQPGAVIDIDLNYPIKVNQLVVRPRKPFQWDDMEEVYAEIELSCSDNKGGVFTIGQFTVKGLNKNLFFQFPEVETDYFRLKIISIADNNPWMEYTFSEVSLLAPGEIPVYMPGIPFHEEKIASVKANKVVHMDSLGTTTEKLPQEVVDLTGRMDADGKLNWKVPKGNWVVYRFGYTLTGARNSPATEDGKGLECDKMDTSALNLHFNHFSKKLIGTAGQLTGNTFKFLLIDSWECAFQNWTQAMPTEFARRRGYELTKWIPVLCGDMLQSAEQSEAFLHDFRATIADLIEENYYKRFMELCHENKLEFHAEVIYGGGGYPPLDIIRANSYCDMPMFEFWAGSNAQAFPEYTPVVRPQLEFPMSAGLFYDKPVIGAEAYTGYAHYSESPQDLKPFGDRAFCQGVNQFILHSYVHQPGSERPGMTLGDWASHFNRGNTVWNYSREWHKYHSRIQSLLQQGNEFADVLFYVGDQWPQDISRIAFDKLPLGYTGILCNFDVLKNRIEVKKNRLIYPGKSEHLMLCLPESGAMALATLERIEQLVKAGAVIYGPRPSKVLSLNHHESENEKLLRISKAMWGTDAGTLSSGRNYGKGKIIWGVPLSKALELLEPTPDFTALPIDTGRIIYTHQRVKGHDIYLVANQTSRSLTAQCIFRITGRQLQVWDPENGTITNWNGKDEGQRTSTSYTFKPYESALFVFLPIGKHHPISYPPIQVPDTLGYTIIKSRVDFQSASKSIVTDTLDIYGWFTQSTLPAVRYFAGEAGYTIHFDVPGHSPMAGDSVIFCPGNFEAIAEFTLNGHRLGQAWSPNRRFNVADCLKENNILEVKVVNTFRNRFIGDLIEFGQPTNVWTSATITKQLSAHKQLKPSGLEGNFLILKYKNTN